MAHAAREGREVVTEQDVLAVLRDAFEEVATEAVQSRDGQRTPVAAGT